VTPVEQSAIARPKSLNELLNELCGPNWASDMELFKENVARFRKSIRHVTNETKYTMVEEAAQDNSTSSSMIMNELELEVQQTKVLCKYIGKLYPENKKLMELTCDYYNDFCKRMKERYTYDDLTTGQKRDLLTAYKAYSILLAEDILEDKKSEEKVRGEIAKIVAWYERSKSENL
jgi:hypothetical protein